MRTARPAALVVALAALVSILLPVSAASAHAFLTGSNPADGASLTEPPSVLRLDFSESVVLEATRIELVDTQGHRISPTRLRIAVGEDTEEPSHVVADLPSLPRGAYRVSWQTLSSDDLHETSGLLVFGVRTAVQATPFSEPAPRAEEAALRWLLLAGLAIALGAQLAVRLSRRSAGSAAAERRLLRLSAAGAGAAAAVAVGLLVDQAAVGHRSVAELLGGGYGVRWTVREAGLLLLVAAALAGSGRLRRVLLVPGAAASALGAALLGHSATGLTGTLADAAHVAAAGIWAGLLLVVALMAVPRVGVPWPLRGVLRGFRVPAAIAVGVMAATGVYLAGGVVGSVDAALRTTYGRTLLIKLAVVAGIGVLGLVNTRRLHRPGRGAVPRRTVLAEAAAAVAVLALAAVLTSGQPAREPEFVTAPAPHTVPVVSAGAADLQQSLALRPNLPGRNVVLVDVFQTRRPAIAPIRRVLVAVAGPDGVLSGRIPADLVAANRWSAPLELTRPGSTRVQVVVQRAGLADVVHDYRWTVGGAVTRTRPALVSTAPIGPALRDTGAVLAVLGLLVLVLAVLRRRTRRATARPPARDPDVTSGQRDLVPSG